MATVSKNVSLELLGAMLKTSLDKIEHLTRITTDLRTDFKGMREQVDVTLLDPHQRSHARAPQRGARRSGRASRASSSPRDFGANQRLSGAKQLV
jgi:hypothetical protein